mgnify:CR=1 FL=1
MERGHTGRVLPYEGLIARLGAGAALSSRNVQILDADAVLARIIPNDDNADALGQISSVPLLSGEDSTARTGLPATEPVATFPVEVRDDEGSATVWVDTDTTLNGVTPA